MGTIERSISVIIRRQMRTNFRQSPVLFLLTTALAVLLLTTIFSSVGFAQQTKAKAKQARARSARNQHSSPGVQTQAAQGPQRPEVQLEPLTRDRAVENADISITAHVRARSLRFEAVPNPTVEFPGQPARDTIWEAVRENLPTPVEPGVTYRDIGIRLKITSVFRDIDRIVAEALGEVPVTEDANSTQTPRQVATQALPASKPAGSSMARSPGPPSAARKPQQREQPR